MSVLRNWPIDCRPSPRVARCARPPPPRPGEAFRPPELDRRPLRPEPDFAKWNRRRRPHAAAPPRRLQQVEQVGRQHAARLARGYAHQEWVTGPASGAVGSVVGQSARIKDARTVGIAGGPDKCRYVTEELGFDACIDHRASDFAARLATACPKVSTFISRMSAARSSRPYSHCSIRSPAFRYAG